MHKPAIRRAELALENERIAETFTRSALRPTLSVYGQANTYTLAPGTTDVFRQMFRYAYPEYGLGFSLTFSIKNRAAQADNLRGAVRWAKPGPKTGPNNDNAAIAPAPL